jgi:phospholipid/cholesterol/gamma-HCH transport system substrate-binding protein
MSSPTNQWKLGLFVVSSIILGLLAIVFLAGSALQQETVRYTSYFDEAVSGLSTGSPITYRGVTIGNVAEINIAPDRRHVEIRYDLDVDDLVRLGLARERGKNIKIRTPADLRVQVGSSGVTGTKYLQLDFFRSVSHPPPKLPFPVPENYIPATASTFKSLEQSVMLAVDQLPVITKQIDRVLSQVSQLLSEIQAHKLPEQAAGALADASLTLRMMQVKLGQLPVSELSSDARGALARANSALGKVDAMMENINSETGMMASVRRASDAVGDVAGGANDVVYDVGSTLRDLRETIDAVRALAEALERDSDMLVKGRAKAAE